MPAEDTRACIARLSQRLAAVENEANGRREALAAFKAESRARFNALDAHLQSGFDDTLNAHRVLLARLRWFASGLLLGFAVLAALLFSLLARGF